MSKKKRNRKLNLPDFPHGIDPSPQSWAVKAQVFSTGAFNVIATLLLVAIMAWPRTSDETKLLRIAGLAIFVIYGNVRAKVKKPFIPGNLKEFLIYIPVTFCAISLLFFPNIQPQRLIANYFFMATPVAVASWTQKRRIDTILICMIGALLAALVAIDSPISERLGIIERLAISYVVLLIGSGIYFYAMRAREKLHREEHRISELTNR